MKYFPTSLSRKQCSDAGMAVCLILLLVGVFTGRVIFYQLAVPALVLNMVVPKIWYFFAVFWFGFSQLLGDVVSRVLLTVVFFVIVTPVGVIRKLSGKDTLKLKDFKRSDASVMISRDHLYTRSDLEKPF
ncbi:MAG: hypothetical protein KAT15_26565 [Bacteroidales bacterium]|nr:hypothetical protein [Bacteroidales bacterium]